MHDHHDRHDPADRHDLDRTASRRGLLKVAGLAVAGGGIAAVALGSGTVRAAHGERLVGALELFGNPLREYDSRADRADNRSQADVGRISAGEVRNIPLPITDQPDDIVAYLFNLTVVDTAGTGFLAVYPDASTPTDTSAINWYADGQIVANQVTSLVAGPDGGVKSLNVACGGLGGSTHFILDGFGYYLAATAI